LRIHTASKAYGSTFVAFHHIQIISKPLIMPKAFIGQDESFSAIGPLADYNYFSSHIYTDISDLRGCCAYIFFLQLMLDSSFH
jgi:hypothetical protein